jgi:adenylylsulfate kinase
MLENWFMIIQFCGLSGAGKSTLARSVETILNSKGYSVEIIDGDEYRKTLCSGLSFSKKDRVENIRRMAFVAAQLSKHGIISIICAINPYEEIRQEVAATYANTRTVHIDCSIETLKIRDTKGLYRKAFLPGDHPDKLTNLTGINDTFNVPTHPDLYINTDLHTIDDCAHRIARFIQQQQKQVAATKWIPLPLQGLTLPKNV